MAAIVTLALGVGANTAIFSLVEAVLLRPLAVQEPSRLFAIQILDARNAGNLMASYGNFKDYRDRNQVVSALFAYASVTLGLTGKGDARLAMGQMVSGNYFSALGVKMAIGRGFLPEEDSVPNANIERAIKKGTGGGETANFEDLTYEIYGPHGVAVLVEVSTDNRNRSASEIRSLVTKNGGTIATQERWAPGRRPSARPGSGTGKSVGL